MTDVTSLGDLAVVRERLAAYFARRLPVAEGLVVSPLSMPANGFSNETAIFDARWTEDGQRHGGSYVLRSPVPGRELFFETDLSLQWRMMQAFAPRQGVPVPGLLWYEDDVSVLGVPFFIMTKVDGRVPPNGSPSYHAVGWVTELPVEARSRLYRHGLEVLVDVHRADWRDGFEFLDRPQHGVAGLDQQLGWVEGWYRWAAQGRRFSVIEDGIAFARRHQPAPTEVAVLWGDCRVGNIVFTADQEVAAVLDWEQAALGPPELDVAWWIMFERLFGEVMSPQRLEGIGDATETVALYEELSGRTLQDLEYYETLAWLRLAVCMIRMDAPNPDDDPEAFVANDPVMRGLAARL